MQRPPQVTQHAWLSATLKLKAPAATPDAAGGPLRWKAARDAVCLRSAPAPSDAAAAAAATAAAAAAALLLCARSPAAGEGGRSVASAHNLTPALSAGLAVEKTFSLAGLENAHRAGLAVGPASNFASCQVNTSGTPH
jgi:hypothetical protein